MTMTRHSAEAIAAANIAIMARFMERMRAKGLITYAEVAAILNGAIDDMADRPIGPEVAAVIQDLARPRSTS